MSQISSLSYLLRRIIKKISEEHLFLFMLYVNYMSACLKSVVCHLFQMKYLADLVRKCQEDYQFHRN